MSILYLVFKPNPLELILFTLGTNLSYIIFLTTSLFTTLLNLLKSTGTVFNLPATVLSIWTFKLDKVDFSANLEVSISVAFFKPDFVA